MGDVEFELLVNGEDDDEEDGEDEDEDDDAEDQDPVHHIMSLFRGNQSFGHPAPSSAFPF